MIGLSVSACCSQMARGIVDPTKVTKIVAGTAAPNAAAWNGVIAEYKEIYWSRSYADKAEMILRQFLAEGRVEQPRLVNGQAPDHRGSQFWVESESEIAWRYVGRKPNLLCGL